MTEIERIQSYIKKTKTTNSRYSLCFSETRAIRDVASKDLLEAICTAFDYGRAKGYREAKAEVRV